MSWTEVETPAVVLDAWKAARLTGPAPRTFERGELTAMVSRDEIGHRDHRWHVSLRYGEIGTNGRVPSWEELVECAHALRPGVVFVVGVPPRSWWINVHPHVLHLWETADENLEGQWRAERAAMRPS